MQPTEWKKKYFNHMLNEGLMSRIHIELIQQNSIKEWAEEQNRHFLKKASKSPPGI